MIEFHVVRDTLDGEPIAIRDDGIFFKMIGGKLHCCDSDNTEWDSIGDAMAADVLRRVYVIKTPGKPDDEEVMRRLFGDMQTKVRYGEQLITVPENSDIRVLPPGWTIRAHAAA
ncbi:hypothetical protein [Rhodopseudomonas palustris]|uniref:hypothetical protein n=1 Tax=Rhodopseudomonas palustris TaxID=1076 RepID=UPI0021F2A460|nr:hypothetical protein [Rhodopseudomonas palustris]UYO55189.1 hypothetical protein KQX61_07240 [Rhodopseudomonas palustris]